MSARLVLNNCKILRKIFLGRVGAGISHIALDALNFWQIYSGMGMYWLIQACLQETVKYAKQRRQFGHTLSMYQLVQK